VEIRCIGLRRSGHHALLNWIRANIDGTYCFINDCQPGRNPFDASRIGRNPSRRLATNIDGFDLAAECAGQHCPKDFLIYNYEEKDLREVESPLFRRRHDDWVGASGRIHTLLVLRDPFNNLASRLMMEDNRRSVAKLPDAIRQISPGYLARLLARPRGLARKVAKRLAGKERRIEDTEALLRSSRETFKDYAREFLGDTEILRHKVPASYNRWFTDEEYREDLARSLDLQRWDRDVDRVAKWGGGSSFDGDDYDGHARDMRVLERWKVVIDDERYRALIDDPELQELSDRIFGPILDPAA
jgi:hypothetical protein